MFLNQDPSLTPTYYKVGVPQDQEVSIHGQSRHFSHYEWVGGGVNYQNSLARQTGVIFTSQNATATAVLKGMLMSNDPNGISSNSQRKIVRTDNGIYHIVYESMGSVWYAYGNNDWIGNNPDILLRENAKNPSIDYCGNNIYIAFEYWDGSLKINFKEINAVDCYPPPVVYDTSFSVSNIHSDFGRVKPVVSCAWAHCPIKKVTERSCKRSRCLII